MSLARLALLGHGCGCFLIDSLADGFNSPQGSEYYGRRWKR